MFKKTRSGEVTKLIKKVRTKSEAEFPNLHIVHAKPRNMRHPHESAAGLSNDQRVALYEQRIAAGQDWYSGRALTKEDLKDTREYFEWSEEDRQLLIELYGKVKLRDLADRLNRSFSSVQSMGKRLAREGIVQLRPRDTDWKPEQVEYLKEHYSPDTIDEIAEHLGRSRKAVQAKVYYLKQKGQFDERARAHAC